MNVKSYWVKVIENHWTTVVNKQFFKVQDANVFLKEMQEKYTDPKYTVIKEVY